MMKLKQILQRRQKTSLPPDNNVIQHAPTSRAHIYPHSETRSETYNSGTWILDFLRRRERETYQEQARDARDAAKISQNLLLIAGVGMLFSKYIDRENTSYIDEGIVILTFIFALFILNKVVSNLTDRPRRISDIAGISPQVSSSIFALSQSTHTDRSRARSNSSALDSQDSSSFSLIRLPRSS